MNTRPKRKEVVKAKLTDLPTVCEIIDSGRRIMRESGNLHQWDNHHPSELQLRKDIEKGCSYLLKEDGKSFATFAFIPGPDITYAEIEQGEWMDTERPYYVIHRVATLPGYHGVMSDILNYCFSITDNIRIDTHRDNMIMQHCLLKAGFNYCGIIHLISGEERLAYQKLR